VVVPVALRSAVELLTGLGRSEPRLVLGVSEAVRLAPLVQQWREAGADGETLRQALTSGLPDRVHSAAGLLADRLRRKLPQGVPRQVTQGEPPEPAGPFGLSECPDCRGPSRTPGSCRACREGPRGEDPALAAFIEAGRRGATRARAALRGLAPPAALPST
jgi:hypothetical protein